MSQLKRFDIVGKYADEETEYVFGPDGECYDADEVDKLITEKDSEIRRLQRALYKACANWAREAKFDYDDEFSLWENMERKCLKKVEEYR